MQLPVINLANLPDLDTLTGVFGALRQPGSDDRIVIIALVVYESGPANGVPFL